jgi:hypothetical protein
MEATTNTPPKPTTTTHNHDLHQLQNHYTTNSPQAVRAQGCSVLAMLRASVRPVGPVGRPIGPVGGDAQTRTGGFAMTDSNYTPDTNAIRPYHQIMLPVEQCIDALVSANGNSALAAERLGINSTELIASIAADPSGIDILNARLRVLATVNTYDTWRQSKMLIDSAMIDMEAADLGKFYTNLLQQVTALTDAHTTTANVNIHEHVLQSLPPEARNALVDMVQRQRADITAREAEARAASVDADEAA